MEVLKNFKDFLKLGAQKYSAAYSIANVPFPAFFSQAFTSSIVSAIFTGACGPPEKLSLTLVLCSCVVHMIVKVAHLLPFQVEF